MYYLGALEVRSAKIKVSAGLRSFWRPEGESFSCLFQLLDATRIPWLVAPFLSQSQQQDVSPTLPQSPLPLTTARKGSPFLHSHEVKLGPPGSSRLTPPLDRHNLNRICKVSLAA